MIQHFCVVSNLKQIYDRPLFNFSICFWMLFLCKIFKISLTFTDSNFPPYLRDRLTCPKKKTLICVQCFDETYKFAYVLFQFSCGNIAISFHSIKLKVMDVSQKLRYKILKALDMWSSTVFMRIMWILRSASVIIVIWNFGIEFIQWDAQASICKG